LKLTLAFLLAGALAACNALAGPEATASASVVPDTPHLELASLDGLFGSAATYLQISGQEQVISFRCTVVEGTFCWFGATSQDGPVAAGLARRIVDQIGPDAIENANRNQVTIRCARPLRDGESACEIDWGWGAGWETLELRR
jgi:hypothetical protein